MSLGTDILGWKGLMLSKASGTPYATRLWNNNGTLTWGTTAIGGGTTYTAGTGLTLSGTQFSVTGSTYAAYSHSHSYDNYVSWRYRTDTTSLEDVISNETVRFSGGTDIGVTHSGGIVTIAYTGSGGDHNTNNTGTHTGRVTGTGIMIEAGDVYKIDGTITGSVDDLSVTSSGYLRHDSSSLVYKENPRPIEVDTSKVLDLAPRTFTWKDIDGIGEEIRGTDGFGLIAEEVHEILPELVTYGEDDNPSGVRYRMISVLLLEEMKKLKARIEVLEGN